MGFIIDWFAGLGPWMWMVIGVLLAIVEIILPGTFFVWFAGAAVLTGVVALFIDLAWQAELLLFVALAGASALIGRKVYGRNQPAEGGHLNDRLARQIGRTASLETPIVNGTGHIRLDDGQWRVEGPDLPAGSQVRIVGHSDGRLHVEPA
jgi:inner membrane protein